MSIYSTLISGTSPTAKSVEMVTIIFNQYEVAMLCPMSCVVGGKRV